MTSVDDRTETRVWWRRLVVLGLTVAGGVAPLVAYWLFLGGVPTVTPAEAKRRLRAEGDAAVLIDVRPADAYRRWHIDGAQSWPLERIRRLDEDSPLPESYQGKTLLLICEVGHDSRLAARHFMKTALAEAVNVRGGHADWISSVDGPLGGRFDRWATGTGKTAPFSFRQSPWHEQLLAVLNGFVIKPTYTVLALILAIVLWRSQAGDLAALRWAMIFFFLGENCCAVNYFVFGEKSYLFEFLHSYGMLLCFSFVTYALLEGIDRRILSLSQPRRRCAATDLCGECVKYAPAPCGLRRMFLLIIPACIAIAAMPLCADPHVNSYNTFIFGTFYSYAHPLAYQLFEIRYCPVAAMVLLTVSMLILIVKRHNPLPAAKIAFAAGMGPLGFGMFRMILAGTYIRNMVYFTFWEEATELLFIVSVVVVLWIFRRGLFPKPRE